MMTNEILKYYLVQYDDMTFKSYFIFDGNNFLKLNDDTYILPEIFEVIKDNVPTNYWSSKSFDSQGHWEITLQLILTTGLTVSN